MSHHALDSWGGWANVLRGRVTLSDYSVYYSWQFRVGAPARVPKSQARIASYVVYDDS